MTAFTDALVSASRQQIGKLREMTHGREPELPLWLGEHVPANHERQPYIIIGMLYSLHPHQANRHTPFPSLLLQLNAVSPQNSIERRFMTLLREPLKDLSQPLEHVVALAARHKLPVDWQTLLVDLRNWDDADKRVQRRWSRIFWAGENDPEMTISEIIRVHDLGPHYDTVIYRAISNDQLPARQSGTTWLVRQTDVEHWLENRPRPGRPRGTSDH